MTHGMTRNTILLRADADGIARAAGLLAAGENVAFPTETVYGLGADANNAAAVDGIYKAKGRPDFNPLIVHVEGREGAARLAVVPPLAARLMDAFWPGPLTLVLPKRSDAPICGRVTAGLSTIAIRAPAHPCARALLAAAGRPLAAPSANPSGRISATTAAHVLQGLDGRIAAVLDGGPCPVGVESTIIGVDGDGARLLRPGGIPAEAIEAVIDTPLMREVSGCISAPGQLRSHYAPAATLRLDAHDQQPGEFMIGFGAVPGDVSLSAKGDLAEAASRLFSCLHAADASGKPIAVAPVPDTGLGRTINDRLRRAAAPRNS